MSIFVKPWVRNARRTFLWVGFGWLALALLRGLLSFEPASLTWALIGTAFLAMIFLPAAILLAVLLPTYQARMIGVPVGLVLVFWSVSSQSATYQGFSLPPYMALWIVTFTAVTLLLPQASTVIAFFRRKR